MKEFLSNYLFLSQVSGFSNSGINLKNGYTKPDSSDVKSLSTAVSYLEQHEQIKKLIDSYCALVEKDARDLLLMQLSIEAMDKSIAAKNILSSAVKILEER